MTGNECRRCGQRVACPHCGETREAATVSELRVSFEDGKWCASGEPCEDGAVRADTISFNAAHIPVFCEALGLVPRRALEIAVGYHADGMIAAGMEEDPPVLFDRDGLIRIGIKRALDAAAKEATR